MLLFVILSVFSYSQDAGSVSVTNLVPNKEAGTLTIHIVPETWLNANLYCLLEGGELASPTTSAIAQAMLTAIAEYKLSSGVFIGVTDLLSRGNFKSVDGKPIANIPLEWAAGEPNNADNSERCLAVTAAGAVADVSCYSVLPFFCRRTTTHPTTSLPTTPLPTTPHPTHTCPTTPPTTHTCPTTPPTTTPIPTSPYPSPCNPQFPGYVWEPSTGSCYKFHWNVTDDWGWNDSWFVCDDEGGYLAVINSETEATVLYNIYKENIPSFPIPNLKDAYIGVIKNATNNWLLGNLGDDSYPDATLDVWVTVDDQTLIEAGFDEWAPGQPDYSDGNEFCGSISYRFDGLHNMDCYSDNPFICEFNP